MKYALFYFSFIICLLSGCSSENEKKSDKQSQTKLGTIITENVIAPEIIPFTATNAPKVIKAKKPLIIPLNNQFGIYDSTSVTNFNLENGLLTLAIYNSVADQLGNIWCSSETGLIKYDGVSFSNYNKQNGLSSDTVWNVFADSKNEIWVVTNRGINSFDGKSFQKLDLDENFDNIGLQSRIFEDSNGSIWFSGNSLSAAGIGEILDSNFICKNCPINLFQYKNGAIKKYSIKDGLQNGLVFKILEDKNRNLLVSTSVGNFIFNGKSFLPYAEIPFNNSSQPILLYKDSKNILWFRDRVTNTLSKYDGNKILTYSKTIDVKFNKRNISDNWLENNFDMSEDNNNNYWITNGESIYKFNGDTFKKFDGRNGFLQNSTSRSLTKDKYGNIWSASVYNGIFKINNSFIDILERKVFINSRVTNYDVFFSIDTSGSSWRATGLGLGIYDKNNLVIYGNELVSKSRPAHSIFISKKNEKWFPLLDFKSFTSQIGKFDGVNFTIYDNFKEFKDTLFLSIDEDREHNIWVSGLHGVTKISKTSITRFSSKQGLKADAFSKVYHDSKNRIWIGSTQGAYMYDGKIFTLYSSKDGLPNNVVNNIEEDIYGNIWFATDGGACKYDGNRFLTYPSINENSKLVKQILSDTINNLLWFSTPNGLVSIKNADINSESPLFTKYEKANGFWIYEPLYKSLTLDSKGRIWFYDGFNDGNTASAGPRRFDYNSLKNFKSSEVIIQNIQLDNIDLLWVKLKNSNNIFSLKDSAFFIQESLLKFSKILSAEESDKMQQVFKEVQFDSISDSRIIPINLRIPYKHNTISFQFASNSTIFVKNLRYQYILEGNDETWSLLSNKKEANYSKLQDGKYTFRVKALDFIGNWSETSYSFTILPPWYRTWWAYLLYLIIFASFLRGYIVFRSRKLKQENLKLETIVENRTRELNRSLKNLKATQTQLIQSEKMASLGELTAGIAHEIQNPLNFVNNFSEVNTELIEELQQELKTGNTESAIAISNDIKENEQKIIHHGKRADAIVKGMLQHSRSGSGQKESTDINQLCDEYLRLAYHGLRAKDKSFNATLQTEFDENIGMVNIMPQDIGRVVLNLITNAFYAVADKAKQGVESYAPTVTVRTKKLNDQLEIQVSDNGNGIPQHIIDKIFQPFFTTKPTGEGTGLGLSLSYDIVKAHGGELKVETKENEGSTFIIRLSIN